MPPQTLTPAEHDALVRFRQDDERAQLEGYFLTLSLPGGRSLQVRIGFLRRVIGRRDAIAEVWAVASNLSPADGSDMPHVALKQTWPMGEVRAEEEILYVRMGPVELTHGRTRGELGGGRGEGHIAWDLKFTRQPEGFRHLPAAWMYRTGLLAAKVTSPQVDARFSGSVTVNGRTTAVEGAPGMLGHHWGKSLSDGWTWAHCNRWHEGDQIVFEGATARVPIGPMTSPPLTVMHVRLPGERLTLNGLLHLVRTRSRRRGLQWRVTGQRGDRRIEATFQAPPDYFVGIDQLSPDGRLTHVLSTGVADGAMVVSGKTARAWIPIVSVVADRSASLQFGTRGDTHGVPISLR